MIPKSISREHVLAALGKVGAAGIPNDRESTKFDLIYRGERFPPKYVLSVAGRMATGVDLAPETFSGGDETNTYLRGLGFTVRAKQADWTEVECYFAVWAYDQLDETPDANKAALFREVAEVLGRTAQAVEYKVQNVAHFDPRPRAEKPIAEAHNAQVLLGQVFRWYWNDRRAARAQYPQFIQQLAFEPEERTAATVSAFVPPSEVMIEEGAPGHQETMRRTRSRELVDHGRKYFKAQDPDGLLRCAACGFVTPEGLARELVQLHHTAPISEAGTAGWKGSLQEAIARLLPLCPTCHGIAHAEHPPMFLARIKVFRSIT
jgi:hypothetical protein